MSRSLRLATTAAAFWAVWAVGHAIRTAGTVAAGVDPGAGRVAAWAVLYFVPLALVGLWRSSSSRPAVWLLLAKHAGEVDSPTIVRAMRMGLTVALFGVLLSWGLVLYSAFVAGLVGE